MQQLHTWILLVQELEVFCVTLTSENSIVQDVHVARGCLHSYLSYIGDTLNWVIKAWVVN